MQYWQELLTKGNQYFHQKNWTEAENYYREAESLLDTQWDNDRNNEGILMAWICSTHNLATLYEKQNEHTVALQYLLIAHKRVFNLAQIGQSNEVLRLIAMKSLKITLTPIILFKKKYPICQDCMMALMDVTTIKTPVITTPIKKLNTEHFFTQLEGTTMH